MKVGQEIHVLCIDDYGTGDHELVTIKSVGSDFWIGLIKRTGKMVKFWEDENNPGDFVGTIFTK